MMPVTAGYGFTLACALIVILGDVILKMAADKGVPLASPQVVIGCALYVLSAALWFFAMRHISLAQGAVAYTVFSLLALCLIGVLFFGERVEPREVAGIGFAALSVILMMRFV